MPFIPRQPYRVVRAPYICVLISIYCGISGSGDLVQASLRLVILVGAFNSSHTEACLLPGCAHHTPIQPPELPGRSSRGLSAEMATDSTVKICWDSNGVDQGLFPVIVRCTYLGTLSEHGIATP